MKKDFLINTIIEVISEFEKHNIRYAILRNYESLNTGLLKDLDLIIDIEDECNIITIINNIYSKNNGLINVQRGFKRTVVSIVTNIGGDVAEEVTFTFDINKYLTLKLKPLHNYFPGLGLNYSIKDLTITTKILGNSDITFKVLKYPQEILFLLNQLIWKKKNEYLTKSNNYLKKINKQPIKDINDNVKIRSSMHDVYILSAILSIQNQFLWKLKILWGNFIVILNQRDSSKIMYFPDLMALVKQLL